VLKDVILLFKFRGYAVLARDLAEKAHAALGRDESLWWGEPVLVPVPLCPARERERGYNQSALLARELSRRSGLRSEAGVLVRRGNAPPQSTLEAAARARNVRGAFAVRRPGPVRGRAVLLVDDVYTTGATLKECAKALLRAGASDVRGITLARA
jgi:ComF family protein